MNVSCFSAITFPFALPRHDTERGAEGAGLGGVETNTIAPVGVLARDDRDARQEIERLEELLLGKDGGEQEVIAALRFKLELGEPQHAVDEAASRSVRM